MAVILIIDDEVSVRQSLRRLLEGEGLAVLEAGSGSEGLGVLGRRKVDAVVIDVLMPDMNGLELFDHLAKQYPDLRPRVMFLTGAAGDPDVNTRIEERGTPLLSKYDDLRLVVDAVRVALVRRHER